MAEITETQIIIKMSLEEARAAHLLLSRLPVKRGDVEISGNDFTPEEWGNLGEIWKVFNCRLGDDL